METELYLSPDFAAEKTQEVRVTATVQPYGYTSVFSSLCIVTGLIWDIFPGTQ
jgi:hypothetical protein